MGKNTAAEEPPSRPEEIAPAIAQADDFINTPDPVEAPASPDFSADVQQQQPVDAYGDEVYDTSGRTPPRLPLLGQTSRDYYPNERKISNYEYAKQAFDLRQEQVARRKELLAQKKAHNASAKEDSRATGRQYSYDPATGFAHPQIDPATGQQAAKQRIQPVQYDDNGKPYQVILNQGGTPGKQITNPDSNAPIGPNPDDPTDTNIYRWNKLGAADTINPEEGVHSPDKAVAVASAKHLHKTMLRSTLQQRTDLGLQIQQLRAGMKPEDLDGSQISQSDDGGDGNTPLQISSGGLNPKSRALQQAIVDGNLQPLPKPAPKTSLFGGVNAEATAAANSKWQEEENQRQQSLAAAQKLIAADDQIKGNRAQMLDLSLKANSLKKEGPAGVLQRLRAEKAQQLASSPEQAQQSIASKTEEINQADAQIGQASAALTQQWNDLQATRAKGGTAAQMAEWDNQAATLRSQSEAIQQQATARNAKADEVRAGVDKINADQAAAVRAGRDKLRENPDTAPLADNLDELDQDYSARKAQLDSEPDPQKRQVALDALTQDVNAKREQTVSSFTAEAQKNSQERLSKTKQIADILQAHDKASGEAQTKMSEYLGAPATPMGNSGIGPIPSASDPIRGHLQGKISELESQRYDKINSILQDTDPFESDRIKTDAKSMASVQSGKMDVAFVQGSPLFSSKAYENPDKAADMIAKAQAKGDLTPEQAKIAADYLPELRSQAFIQKAVEENPGNVTGALYKAQADGKIQPSLEQLQLAKQADDNFNEISKAAGDLPGAKAFLKGVSIGAPAMVAFSKAGPIGATWGAKLPSLQGQAIGASLGYLIAGMSAAMVATFAARKGFDFLGEYSQVVNSFNASEKLHPGLEAAGEFLGGIYQAPESVANLGRLGKMAYSNAVEEGAAQAAARMAAFKIVGTPLAEAVGSQIVFTAAIQPAFEAAIYSGAHLLGIDMEAPQVPTVKSFLLNIGAGIALAGHSVTFKDYSAGKIASVMVRGKSRENLGIPLDSTDAAHTSQILKSFDGTGIQIDSSNAHNFVAPLSAEERQLYTSLSQKIESMMKSGKFEGKSGDFASTTQASVKTSGKENVLIISGGVIAKENPPVGPGPGQPSAKERTSSAPSLPGSPEKPASAPADTAESLHLQLAKLEAARKPGVSPEKLAALDHYAEIIGQKLEALGAHNPNKPKPEDLAVTSHEISAWQPPAEMKLNDAIITRNAASASVKILSGSQIEDLSAAERVAMNQKLPGKEPRYEDVNGMPVLTSGQLAELQSIAPSSSRIIRMDEGQARAYAGRIPLRAKFQKGGVENGKSQTQGGQVQGGGEEVLTQAPKGDLAGTTGEASPTPVIPIGKAGSPLTSEEQEFSNEISSQLQNAGANKSAAIAFAAHHVRQVGAKAWSPANIESAKIAFENAGGFTDPKSLLLSIKSSANSQAPAIEAIHKKILKGWGKKFSNLKEHQRTAIESLLKERFIPELLIYGRSVADVVGNKDFSGGAGIGVAKQQVHFNLNDLASIMSDGKISAQNMHGVETAEKTLEEEVWHIAHELILSKQRQGRHPHERTATLHQLALLEAEEIFHGLPKDVQIFVRKTYESGAPETDAALGMEFLRMLCQHDIALEDGKLINADGIAITEQTLSEKTLAGIRGFIRDLLKFFSDIRKNLSELLAKEGKGSAEIESLISRIESIRKESVDLFKSWKKQADESRSQKYRQEYDQGRTDVEPEPGEATRKTLSGGVGTTSIGGARGKSKAGNLAGQGRQGEKGSGPGVPTQAAPGPDNSAGVSSTQIKDARIAQLEAEKAEAQAISDRAKVRREKIVGNQADNLADWQKVIDKAPADARSQVRSLTQQAAMGKPSYVLAINNERLPASYVALPPGSVQASHIGAQFQKNPDYAGENTRDYATDETEQNKVRSGSLPGALNEDILTSTDPSSANSSPQVAIVISAGADGKPRALWQAAGGNAREMMTQLSPLEDQERLSEAWADKAAQFGFTSFPEGNMGYRFLGVFDVRSPEGGSEISETCR